MKNTDVSAVINMLNSTIFKSSLGLAAGFLGAAIGGFLARVFLSNEIEIDTLKDIFALGSLIALFIVVSVEGFTSLLSVSKTNLLSHFKSLSIISVVFSSIAGLVVVLSAAMTSNDYSFILSSPYIILLSLIVGATISVGQILEIIASRMGKNLVPFWRRASTQFITLGIFAAIWAHSAEWSKEATLLAWFACAATAGAISATTSYIWVFGGEQKSNQETLRKTREKVMGGYLTHHISKLGLVLPRFIIPVLVVIILGAEVGVSYVLLWTILGLISVSISSVTRGYLNYSSEPKGVPTALFSWAIIIFIPSLLIFLYSDSVMAIFGPDFTSLGYLLKIGLLSLIPYALFDFSLAWLKANGRVKLSSILSISSGIILVSLIAALAIFGGGLTELMYGYLILYSIFGLFAPLLVYLISKKRSKRGATGGYTDTIDTKWDQNTL